MITIEATIPCSTPPAWAVLERKLMEVMDQSVYPYLEKYTREDGTLIYRDDFRSRDGADDFYESFYNWPLFYLLGGGEHMLSLAHREWEAITRQLTAYGNVYKEYERGYDQFHQAESYIYFYLLGLADPTNPRLVERARRFAGLYLNEDPEAPNYDPEHRLIRGPHNGSTGPHAARATVRRAMAILQGWPAMAFPMRTCRGSRAMRTSRTPRWPEGWARLCGRA